MKLYEDALNKFNGYEDLPKKVIFQILTSNNLPFEFSVDVEGNCIADELPVIDLCESEGDIKVIKRGLSPHHHRFIGRPEPILNGTLKIARPIESGKDIEIVEFGGWECQRCGHVTVVGFDEESQTYPKPFECDNDVCGRKGPFKPQFPKNLIKPVWKPPLPPVECTSEDVYSSVYNFCKDQLVLQENEYHLITMWILASWLVEDFQTCPYLCMIAPKGSGKTQVLGVLSELAYRAVQAISVTAPSLFRSIELWKITLLIDEAEYQVKQDTEAGQALYGCLNGGYKRGSFAIRTEGEGGSRLPTAYDVFGFKAIATTKLFHPTLESRSIIINMARAMPKKILMDYPEGALIRSKLLFWRFENLNKLKHIQPESRTGRLIEIFTPLFTITQIMKKRSGVCNGVVTEDFLINILNEKLHEMEDVGKEEECASTEAQVIQVIFDLIGLKLNPKDTYNTISIDDIADKMLWNEPGANKRMGKLLKVLGIKSKHTKIGSLLFYNEKDNYKKLLELKERFLK